jgi:hypothetical protein
LIARGLFSDLLDSAGVAYGATANDTMTALANFLNG